MSADKTFLGRRMMDFSSSPAFQPFSRVTLWVDDNNCYTAGDDSGRTLEADCPWATQEICNVTLARIKGYQYVPYTATDAMLDPAAEIGDGVTVNGLYSVLASIDSTFDTMFTANAEAPSDEELDHEFPYKPSTTRNFDRKIAQTRAEITVKADEIITKVEDELNGLSSSIDVKLDSITSNVNGIEGRVSTVEQTASKITSKVESSVPDSSSTDPSKNWTDEQKEGNVGYLWYDTSDEKSRKLKKWNGTSWIDNPTDSWAGSMSSVEQKVDSLTLSVSNGEKSSTIKLMAGSTTISSQTIQFTGDVVFKSNLTDGTTQISGNNITTGKISANYIKLGGNMDLYESLDSDTVIGRFGKNRVTINEETYETLGFVSLGNEYLGADGILFQIASRSIFMVGTTGIIMNATGENAAVAINAAGILFNGSVIHYSSSDRTLKKNIRYDRCDELASAFDGLKPVTFDMEHEFMDEQHHIGFIAQDVKEAMENAGFQNTLVAKDNRGKYVLNYGEMVALLTAKIKQLEKRLEVLEQ